jgi:filamentous hemagglutinin family protein
MTARSNPVPTLWRLSAVTVALACVFAADQAQANGTAPTVVSGQASFSTLGSSLSITNSPGAIINWQGFSIGAGETTRFIQQSAASSVLNRVIGSDPSVILGTLISNGRVFLINPSGILFGQGSRVDVAGLVASTLDLSNQGFLAGRLNFASNPLAGNVENQGRITTPSGGNIYLVGSNVTNSGIINSPQGDVILAAGKSVNIFDTSTPGVRVEITASDNAAVNLGEILAQSGQVGIYGAALHNAGIINADQVGRNASGKIVLRATQDVTLEAGSRISANGEKSGEITIQSENGTTMVSGTIEAKGTGEVAGNGGTVQLLGNQVGLVTASVDVSGTTGGGTVLVGGNFHGAGPQQNAFATTIGTNSSINTDAINSGNGGQIAVWSNGDTSIGGTLTARGGANSGDGGFVETSGKHVLLADSTRVNTLAPHGKTGLWLLDPTNWTIAVAGDETPASVITSLDSSDRLITATNDITVSDAVVWTTPQTLTLNAGHDVLVNAAMTASTIGAGIVLIAGNDVTATAALTASASNAVINMSAGHNVSVVAVTANGGGSVNLRANNDVIVNGAITADTGLDSVILRADNDGTGPGSAGGTVTFVGTGAVVTPRTIIRFNPVDYSHTASEIANYVTKVSALLDAKAWVFAQGTDKVYNGNTDRTATVNSLKPDLSSVASGASLTTVGALFDGTGDVGTNKPITFTSYTLTDVTNSYALFTPFGITPGAGTATANINPLAVTLTAPAVSKTYDGGLTYTATAGDLSSLKSPLVGGDTVTAATIAYTNKNAGAGTKTVNLNAATISDGNSGNNYTVTLAGNSTSTISPLAVTLTAPAVSKTYDGGLTYTATAGNLTSLESPLVGGDTVTAAAIAYTNKNASAGNKTVNLNAATISDGNGGNNYTVTLAGNSTSTITPANLAINAVTDSKIYDGTATSAGVVSVGTLYSTDTVTGATQAFGSKDVLGTSGSSLSVTGYTVNDGNGGHDYTVTSNTATGTITPAPLGIAANSAARPYGDANPAFSATYTGFKNGETTAALTGALAFATSAIPTSNVGNYAITLSGQSSTNYTITYVNGTLGVVHAPLGIAANSTSKTYGSTMNFTGTEFSSTGLKNGETVGSVSLSSAGATSTASVAGSPYAITASAATGGTFNASNYTISYVDGALGVIPAGLLGIAANSAVKIYNGLAYSGGNGVIYTGFQGADTAASLTGTLVYGGSSQGAVNVGNYAIIPSGQSSPNYTIVYVNGNLSVIPAALGIAANSSTRLYGGANPAFSATYTGFQNGETSAALSGTLVLATPAIPTSNVGNYAITPSGQSSTNYTITYVNGTLGVTPVSLMATANTQSKVYGTIDPTLTFSVTGLVNNPALGVVDTAGAVFSGALTRASGETVLGGPYAITQGTLAANSNYTLRGFTGNTLTITPATLTVATNAQSKVYGTSDPALSFSVTGLINNPALGIADTASTVFSGALTRVPGEAVLGGPYAITQGSLLAANSNYTLSSFTGNTLTITPAALNVVANPQSKVFGTGDPALTFNVTGLVNNPTLGIADTASTVLSGALTRVPGESALGGPYAITQGSLAANSNYTLGFTHNNLIIIGAAAEPILGFNAEQVIFAGVINNEFYYHPGNFWHISLNSNNADPGFDVMRGTNDSDSNSHSIRSLGGCDEEFCETWSFPQQFEKALKK